MQGDTCSATIQKGSATRKKQKYLWPMAESDQHQLSSLPGLQSPCMNFPPPSAPHPYRSVLKCEHRSVKLVPASDLASLGQGMDWPLIVHTCCGWSPGHTENPLYHTGELPLPKMFGTRAFWSSDFFSQYFKYLHIHYERS